MNNSMVWGLLIHVGRNFVYRRKPLVKLEFELDAFRRITERMAADFKELLRVMEDPALTEFQYVPNGDEWDVATR